jgi:hypothetical protein
MTDILLLSSLNGITVYQITGEANADQAGFSVDAADWFAS